MFQIKLASLVVLLILSFPTVGSSNFVAYRISKNYIIIGVLISHKDEPCGIEFLDDKYVFTQEWAEPTSDPIDMTSLAQNVFHLKPNATTGDLLEAWMSSTELRLKSFLTSDRDEAFNNFVNEAKPPISVTRGFFGEVRASGSKWSIGEISINRERTKWRETKSVNQKANEIFFSRSKDPDMMQQVLDRNQLIVPHDVDSDTAAMAQVLHSVGELARNREGTESVPIVATLEYGKRAHWSAGGDICKPAPK